MSERGGLNPLHDFPKDHLLELVAKEDFDAVPDDGIPDHIRFIVASVRAAVGNQTACSLCVFVYSEAPLPERRASGFVRVLHMQDGHGEIDGHVILAGRDVNNGARRALTAASLDAVMDDLETLGLDTRWTLIWDGGSRVATFYPLGIAGDAPPMRYKVPSSSKDLTQEEVCSALFTAYNDNMKNPSAHTVKLWDSGKLVSNAEDEIERHLKGQLALFFAGREREIKILAQINTSAGRTDLLFLQRIPSASGPQIVGVLELKVLRGPEKADWESTREGLSQGYNYRQELQVPFAMLALFDVSQPPSHVLTVLLANQEPSHIALVRVDRFPLYISPKAWRDAGSYRAA